MMPLPPHYFNSKFYAFGYNFKVTCQTTVMVPAWNLMDLGSEPRASHLLSTNLTTELHPNSAVPQLFSPALNLKSVCRPNAQICFCSPVGPPCTLESSLSHSLESVHTDSCGGPSSSGFLSSLGAQLCAILHQPQTLSLPSFVQLRSCLPWRTTMVPVHPTVAKNRYPSSPYL